MAADATSRDGCEPRRLPYPAREVLAEHRRMTFHEAGASVARSRLPSTTTLASGAGSIRSGFSLVLVASRSESCSSLALGRLQARTRSVRAHQRRMSTRPARAIHSPPLRVASFSMAAGVDSATAGGLAAIGPLVKSFACLAAAAGISHGRIRHVLDRVAASPPVGCGGRVAGNRFATTTRKSGAGSGARRRRRSRPSVRSGRE